MIRHTWQEVVNICSKASDKNFKSACFDSLGFIAVANSQGKADMIMSSCNKISAQEFRAKCLISAAGELIFQNVLGWQESSKTLCQSLSEGYQKACFEYIENIKKDYNRI